MRVLGLMVTIMEEVSVTNLDVPIHGCPVVFWLIFDIRFSVGFQMCVNDWVHDCNKNLIVKEFYFSYS